MLADLRVLDLSTEFGLMCGQLLADMGADVQQWVAPANADRLGSCWHWRAYTLGKHVQVIDWHAQAAALRAALGRADVLIESEPVGSLEALGLGPAELARLNPRLIHVSITGFGSDGPKAHWAYTDLTATAASGHLYVTGSADQPPVRISAPQAHAHASSDAAVAVLIALADRHRTGTGQRIDVAGQQSSTLALLSRALDGTLGQPKVVRSAYGGVVGDVHLRNQFPARDGWVVVLQGVVPPMAAFMQRLMAWVLEEGLCTEADTRWPWGQVMSLMVQGQITPADWAPVQDGIAALVAGRSKLDLMTEAVARRLLIAPVFSVGDVLDSEQLRVRGFVAESRDGPRPGAFARFSRSPLPLRAGAPSDWAEPAPAEPGLGFTPLPGDGPLAGLKVLDLFWIVAGPGATRMLADYGATVVHVESTQRLDMVRNVPPYIGGVPDPERAGCHHSNNCNKLNISLDLGSSEGRAVLEDLIRWADVLTESFAPGVIERLGIDYPRVQALNPGIIMISSCLMGQSGPWSPYAGYGNLAAAVSGFHALTGLPGAPPTGCFGPYTDFTSIRFNALAILGALRHRAATGEGQYIDMAQAEAALHFLAPECLAWLREGREREAVGNRDARDVPSGVYPALGDDRWVAIAVRTPAEWRALCALAGFDDLAGAELAEAEARRAIEDRIDARLCDWTRGQAADVLEARLQDAGIPAHRVLDTHDLASDPQLVHRAHVIPVEHRTFSPAAVESTRLRFSRTRALQPRYAPWFGIDNERVLAELLGYTPQRVASLQHVLR